LPGDAGLGLAGMAGRAALYVGTVSAGPASDDYWTVYATRTIKIAGEAENGAEPFGGPPNGTPTWC